MIILNKRAKKKIRKILHFLNLILGSSRYLKSRNGRRRHDEEVKKSFGKK